MKAKKLFSALLAVVMVFGLLCTPAFAAGKADTLATGPISVADNEDYYNSFEWAYGENTFGGHMVDYPGCHTLTTDFLVEKFGANTLLMFWGEEQEHYIAFLLTGKEAPAGVVYPLADPLIEENHEYDLTGKITRAEFARIAVDLYYGMSGEDVVDGLSNPFVDVDEDTDFFKGILAAYKLGIVKGTSTSPVAMTFEPNKLVSRQEVAVMLARVFEIVGGEIAAWAKDAVAFMTSKGIINGVGGNRFDPKGNASVEQALKIAVEMLDKLDV